MLSHPNVIGYHRSDVENRALVISMEYAAGGTLAEYILSKNSTHLSEFEVMIEGNHTMIDELKSSPFGPFQTCVPNLGFWS